MAEGRAQDGKDRRRKKRSLKRRELEIQRDAKMMDGILSPIRAEQTRRYRRKSQLTGTNHRARRDDI
ncbi:hypothetical protein ASPFODRAFT_46990 [Aspergillus luchuensis CBS 106.47]|uniref:Uncharacterized protein n=1 Tax=Aspergillus luchuensis (strain CBS 106.47) TaxID=1137211 RepID=A0A1M3TGK6_ASPLC|nr:hypothetical protein ASPFODRAFT_46990 [Aspergillus luchuensis CBS 106.47]